MKIINNTNIRNQSKTKQTKFDFKGFAPNRISIPMLSEQIKNANRSKTAHNTNTVLAVFRLLKEMESEIQKLEAQITNFRLNKMQSQLTELKKNLADFQKS